MKNYEKLKKVIQEAVPEIMERYLSERDFVDNFTSMDCVDWESDSWKNHFNIVRLADVLLAIEMDCVFNSGNRARKAVNKLVNPQYENGKFISKMLWDLQDNNLDHQSDECKKFLIKLLVV